MKSRKKETTEREYTIMCPMCYVTVGDWRFTKEEAEEWRPSGHCANCGEEVTAAVVHESALSEYEVEAK